MFKVLNNQQGFTLVEVLVSAVVFMIGFSILVFMLEKMITGYSADELTAATNLGTSLMEQTLAEYDTLPQDTISIILDVHYRITKKVQVEEKLAGIDIKVSRYKTRKELCRLYAEFIVP